ncbi:MAG: HupE/UreJ family protein [Myxococcota bacterium]
MMRTFGLFIAFILWTKPVDAHVFDPNILQLQETSNGTFVVSWTTSTPDASSWPQLPQHCVAEAANTAAAETARPQPAKPASTALPGQRASTWWRIDCAEQGLAGASIVIQGPSADADTLVRLHRRDGTRWTTVAKAAGDTITLPDDTAHRWAVVQRYFVLGVEHIAQGVDHLLFLVALWFLVSDRRSLMWTVTAFTIGHSITLVLATLNIVTPHSAPVELLIALSIAVLARQMIWPRPSGQQTWIVALGFGLLHGFGFAGALRALGIPSSQIVEALGAFNLGVEAGQLVFILGLTAIARMLARWLRSYTSVGRHIVAHAIGATAVLWTVERAFQLGA